MMIEVEFSNNFDDIDQKADELLTEYDSENDVEYNFKKFAFVAKENAKTLGYLTGFSYYSEVVINNLVVLKKYRKKGIGTKLMSHIESHFASHGFNNINLVTNAFQAPKFYEKCGYRLEFIRKNDKNPKFTKYFYVKYF